VPTENPFVSEWAAKLCSKFYVPTPGTEHIFVKPSFAKSKTRKQRGGKQCDGKQCGGSVSFAGIGSIGALTWVGLILFLVIQAGNSGAFRGSSR
jgi:hypothetical protein